MIQVMKYHKEGLAYGSRKEASVYERIPYEPGSLMILQAAKRIAHISLDNSNHLSGIIKRSTNMLRL